MAEIFSFILVVYIMTIGLGLLFNGPRGVQRVNRFWLRIITGVIGWILNIFGDLLKALGKMVHR